MIRTAILAAALIAAPGTVHAQARPVDRATIAPVATQTDHLTIVTTIGDGPPVILIPGLASPRQVWDGVVPELAKTHRVYLVQVRGFAGDDPGKNLEPGVLDGIVADLDRYITRGKLGKPAIVGHSMGGLVGMMLAARHPDKVGRLMVVDALPFFGVLFGAKDAATAKPMAEQARAQVQASPQPTAPITIDPGGIWSNTPAGRIQVSNWSMKANPRVVAQALYEDVVTDMRPELGKITAKPFTVLYATGAGPQAKLMWEREFAGSPATLVPVPDSYHFIMLDQPARFAEEMTRFLTAR